MLSELVVVAIVAATPRLAVLDFIGVNVDPRLLSFCSETFAARLTQGDGLVVTTQQDIANVLGLERQRQLLGCETEAGSCVAELAGALGVTGIASGQVARLGDRYQLTVRVTGADGKPLSAVVESGAEAELARAITRLAQLVRIDLVEGERGRVDELRRAQWVAFIPIALGVVAGGVAGGLFGVSASQRDQLTAADAPRRLTDQQAQSLRDSGKQNQTIGLVLVGLGAASLAAGVVWRLVLPDAPAIGLLPTTDGASFVLLLRLD